MMESHRGEAQGVAMERWSAKHKLALVVVTIVNVDGGMYRVIRGHFGSRVTPENFKGGSQ